MRALQGAAAALPHSPVDHRGSVTLLECGLCVVCKMPPTSPGPFPGTPMQLQAAQFLQALFW